MKFEKKVIGTLEKCYSLASLKWNGKNCCLVAAEKHDACRVYDEEGNYLDTVWDEPGGVMTMVQIPGKDGEFLATHRFYSPNDSKEASLVYARHENGGWKVTELTKLPFVHRFDILTRNGVNYLIACALKSDHEYKDDWRFPGKVFAAVLPEDLSVYGEAHGLEMTVIAEDFLKNHGYTRCMEDGVMTGIVSCEGGVYQFFPPKNADGSWTIRQLLSTPASDAVKMDLDGDGRDELFVISPFHGDTATVYHENDGIYTAVYEHPEKLEMLHAIDKGVLNGTPCIVFGYRKGKRELMYLCYDAETASYRAEVIDEDRGPANVLIYEAQGDAYILAANRETDEIAQYKLVK